MIPTRIFWPFGGEGPKVVLCGKGTGNWNHSRFQGVGDHSSDTGLYFRLNTLAKNFLVGSIALLSPQECNTKILKSDEFPRHIQDGPCGVLLRKGEMADGMILPQHYAGAIASADCPTIVMLVGELVIIAHAGSKSLIDTEHVLYNSPARKYPSVVNSMMDVLRRNDLPWEPKVFITCGISAKNYRYPELAPFVKDNFGSACVTGGGIDLKKIIAVQFEGYNVTEVLTDSIDTYEDEESRGCPRWHSYRRDKTPARNLVLVVN